MKKRSTANLLLVCIVALGLALSGCGSASQPASPTAATTVSGIASLDTAGTSTVSVRDSSMPAREKTAASNSNGAFTFDVRGLKPPFVLKAEGTDQTLYSISKSGGRTNINPLSDTAVAASANDTNPTALYTMQSSDDHYRRSTDNFEGIIYRLRTVLAPLYALYQISGNAVYDDDDDDDDERDNSGLRALFNDVRFIVDDGRVVVKNRLTGGVIFSGSLRDLSAGTFYPENMPAGPGGSTSCTYTYDAWGACQSTGTQTRNLLTSSPAGCTGTPILSQACTYVPPTPTACTYTYGAWGACQSTGMQLRDLLSSSPAGCTGTPVLTRACTYVPPVTTCTSFTYSAWGACQSNNTQTRTLATSSPAGCTGGTPVLSQACTYVPPTPVCGSCHAIPPSTGQHSFHYPSRATCSTCHGAGYSPTAVTAATHINGVTNVVSTMNYNATTGTCGSPGCHGSRSW